jgi:hypothetical protein
MARMKRLRALSRENARLIALIAVVAILLFALLFNRLGSLVGGLSRGEIQSAMAPVGWHGIYHSALYLPLKLVRSVVFWLSPNHGQTLTRLPNALFGGLTIIIFTALIRLWHGWRTAILTSVLFATSAWVLHVSRLASFDVLYLLTIPGLLFANALLTRYPKRKSVWYGSLIYLGFLLYVPGVIWLILTWLYFTRKQVLKSWQQLDKLSHRLVSVLLAAIFLPLLILDLAHSGQIKLWLGLPAHISSAGTLLKSLVAAPVHLFIRGPKYPDIWLSRVPILDVFTLVACVLGIYFYVTHLKASRSKLLLSFAVIGWLLVAATGPVGLSLLVPLLYVAAAAGIAFLLKEWLQVFPFNPVARTTGIVLVSLLVVLASVYNLKAYFVAWPHNAITKATFRYHR